MAGTRRLMRMARRCFRPPGWLPLPQWRRPGWRPLLCAALFSAVLPAWALEGTVLRVSDGDTFWLRVAQHKHPLRVRLQGIDAPELCQTGGVQARQALEALVAGRRVVIRSRAVDRYGRKLAQVLHGGKDVAEQLVSQGWAWSDTYRGQAGPYAASERAARAARRGLFAQPGAVSPRAFRQEHGACISPSAKPQPGADR